MGTTNDAVNLILQGEPFRNFCHSFYDEFVEQNVTFRHRAGVKSLIIRRNLGGCCDWCQNLAGIYVYGEEPKDVYRRHDSCRCLVTSKFEGQGYQDIWSKQEFETQKEARIARLKEYEEKIAKERSLKPKVYDTTEKWFKSKSRRGKGEIKYKEYVEIDGEKFPIDGHDRKFEISEIERNDAELIINKLGGIIELNPNINNPAGHTLGDYEYNGIAFDHKHIETDSENAIKNRINKSIRKGQAENFVINITGNPADTKILLRRIEKAYEKIYKLKTVIVIRDNKIIKIYERI